MPREELSGAVRIFCQTMRGGTAMAAALREPYSTRQSRTFIVIQNKPRPIKITRESMAARLRDGRDVQTLSDLQMPGIEFGIGPHKRVEFDAISFGDGCRS